MQRVMIIGQPGGIERSREEKTICCHRVEARDQWIFEGGHSATWPNRAARADLVIWLDVPLWRRAWRVVWRSVIWQGRTRPDLPPGCPERLGRETLVFWAYIWRTRTTGRQSIQRLLATLPPDKRVVHLRSTAEVADFLSGFPGKPAAQ